MNNPEIDELLELLEQEYDTYSDILVKATHKVREHEMELDYWKDVHESAIESRRGITGLKTELFKFRTRLNEVDINE